MDIKEAQDIIGITEDEEKAIGSYVYYGHIRINLLSDFSPETYDAFKNKSDITKTVEDFKGTIQGFVNIYSAMYKESKNSRAPKNLVRGTSNKMVRRLSGANSSFLSTSTREDIAKTFTEYGDGALVHFNVEEGVPYLDATKYRDENSMDEYEFILAPFCDITVYPGRKSESEYGFSYYNATVKKPKLEEKTPEELSMLQEELLSRFSQNLEDMKEVLNLQARLESLDRLYMQAQGNRREQQDILEGKRSTQERYDKLRSSTFDFKRKLQTLLKGMCRQKEIEIDEAHKIIEGDAQKRREEEEKKRQEEERKIAEQMREEARRKITSQASEKIAQSPETTSSLQDIVTSTYQSFIKDENQAKEMAEKFGVPITRVMAGTSVEKLVEQISQNTQAIQGKASSITIDENTPAEDMQNISDLLDGVSYGIEVTSTFKDIEDLHRKQLLEDLKKGIYDKVQAAIQSAKIQKYLQEKQKVSGEQIGFFGRLFGKELLKAEKLKNLDLKIRLAKMPTENTDGYSIRNMLTDMRICADTELGGNLNEMQGLYNLLLANFGEGGKNFTDEYIKKLAAQKLAKEQKAGLPVVQTNSPRFGKTKAQARMLAEENANMQRKILTDRTTRSTWVQRDKEDDAITLLEQRLKGIANNTSERESQRDMKDPDNTLDLWGK